MNRKAFVLLSGGMDSTTCLFQAIYDFAPKDMAHGYGDQDIIREFVDSNINVNGLINNQVEIDWVEAISINYGQRHLKETVFAAELTRQLGIKHTILDLRNILSGDNVMLTDRSVEVPSISYADIQGVSPTYVPFRNGTLLSIITAHAQKYVNQQIDSHSAGLLEQQRAAGLAYEHQEQDVKSHATNQARDLVGIYFGAHSEDAHNWAYPDCTPEFIGAMANAIYVGSYFCIRLHTPIMWLTKGQIVELGERLGVPWSQTWSCYKGEELHCGTCPTCRARRQAFQAANVNDPTKYAE